MHEVKKYAEFHFASEENLMHDLRYPGLDEHRKRHSEMLSELSIRIGRANASWRNASHVLEFLTRWLDNHVRHDDRQFAMLSRQ
jgi:hemerythrin-like metal-binding protein